MANETKKETAFFCHTPRTPRLATSVGTATVATPTVIGIRY